MTEETKKFFTQTELDQIITDRLARQKKGYEDKLGNLRDEVLAEANKVKLEEQQKYKELYEEAGKSLSELEPLRGRVGDYEKYFERVLEERLKELGDSAKQAVKHLGTSFDKLDWLEANKELFAPKGSGVGTPRPGGKQQKGEPERKLRLPSI